jgi:hypothetical protein
MSQRDLGRFSNFEVALYGCSDWDSAALRFSAEEQAIAYGRENLAGRWYLVAESRAATTSYRYHWAKLESIPVAGRARPGDESLIVGQWDGPPAAVRLRQVPTTEASAPVASPDMPIAARHVDAAVRKVKPTPVRPTAGKDGPFDIPRAQVFASLRGMGFDAAEARSACETIDWGGNPPAVDALAAALKSLAIKRG